MENTETNQQVEANQHVENDLTFSNEIKSFLLETSKWAKFMAILGFIGMGFMVLIGFAFMVGMPFLGNIPGGSFPLGFFGIFYFLIGVLYYFPISYLYKFAVNMKSGLLVNDTNAVTYGFQNLKSHYKFIGIFMIVVMSLYALIIAIMVPLAIFKAF